MFCWYVATSSRQKVLIGLFWGLRTVAAVRYEAVSFYSIFDSICLWTCRCSLVKSTMWVREVKIHVVAYKRCQLPVRVFYRSLCSLMQKVRVSDLYLGVFFLVTATQQSVQECLPQHRGPFVLTLLMFLCLKTMSYVAAHSYPPAADPIGCSYSHGRPSRSSAEVCREHFNLILGPRLLWSPATVVAWELTPAGCWSPLTHVSGCKLFHLACNKIKIIEISEGETVKAEEAISKMDGWMKSVTLLEECMIKFK